MADRRPSWLSVIGRYDPRLTSASGTWRARPSDPQDWADRLGLSTTSHLLGRPSSSVGPHRPLATGLAAQQHWSTGDCSAREGGQQCAHDDRGDPSGGQLVTDTALRRRRCSVMQPCRSRVEEGTRRCKHR
jgi:hypothetical protein